MIAQYHLLHLAQRLDLMQASAEALHVVHAGHRGAQLEVPDGWLSIWLPLRGDLQLESTRSHWTLPRSHLLIAREARLQGGSRAAVTWVVVAGSCAAWNALLTSSPNSAQAGEILPRQWPCPRELRRLLVHLARVARAGDSAPEGEYSATLHRLRTAIFDRQGELQPFIDRCNGRTPLRRVLTLQRLLRVHQLIERDCEGRIELHDLARSASYSPWHLIRMYRAVFGETPSEHGARLRLDRAWSLVRDTAMPVCEITEKLGFESQSAFCRAFKNAYGLTTTQVRGLPTAIPSRTSPRPSTARGRRRPLPLCVQR